MTTPIKILAFAGSTRSGSFNKKLARLAADLARDDHAEVTLIDLKEYPAPLFDGDLEDAEGMPKTMQALKRLVVEHDALLLACPEYNSSITGVLKNTIDWLSRVSPSDDPGDAYEGKVAATISTSPGGLGGLRGLVHVRCILTNLGVLVIPDQLAIPGAAKAFDADGRLTDEGMQKRLKGVVTRLIQVTQALKTAS